MSQTKSDLEFTVVQEDAFCVPCNSIIPRDCIASNINKTSMGHTTQIVKAWCEHCNRVYRSRRILRGGNWQITGETELVTNPKERDGFMRRIEHVRGETRIKHYPQDADASHARRLEEDATEPTRDYSDCH